MEGNLLIQLRLIISMINGRIEAVAKRNDCDRLRWNLRNKKASNERALGFLNIFPKECTKKLMDKKEKVGVSTRG